MIKKKTNYSTTSIIRTHVTSDTPIIRRLPRFGHFAIFTSIIRTNQNIKVSYRKDLLNYIISHEDDNIVQLLTSFNNNKKKNGHSVKMIMSIVI
jgi:hypothetical protein